LKKFILKNLKIKNQTRKKTLIRKKRKKRLIQFAKLMVFLKREKVLMERNLNSIVDLFTAYNINLT
tara:strand:- start:171 stop:368 length:198 start_codon:yes stop_codon:yes gene_type:complete